jgi:hypothetical protein
MMLDQISGLGLEAEIAGKARPDPASFHRPQRVAIAATKPGVDLRVFPTFDPSRLAMMPRERRLRGTPWAASRQSQGIPARLWHERLRQVLSPASRAAAFHHAAWCRGWHQFLAPLSGPPVGGNLIQSHHWLRGWLAKAPSLSWLANRQRWLNSVRVHLIELWR